MKVLVLFDSIEPHERGYAFEEELKTEEWRSEREILRALESLGHETRLLGLHDDVQPLLDEVRDFRPDLAFNLVEEFRRDHTLEPNVAGLLELLNLPFTGAPASGLRIAKDKALSKAVLLQHDVPTPPYQLIERGRAAKRAPGLEYPLVVKPSVDDASYGIAQASVAEDDKGFEDRVRYVHEKAGQDALVESYIEGREVYVSVLGSSRLRVFPLREVRFGRLKEGSQHPIATYTVKWDAHYRKRWGVQYAFVKGLDDALTKRIEDTARAAFRALFQRGYARVDMRVADDGTPYVLEVNPNPHLAREEDYALSAKMAGLPFTKLIQSILTEALNQPSE